MRRLLCLFLVLLVVPASVWAVTTPNSNINVQVPQVASTVIVSGVAQCTAANQPWACCTASGVGATCNVTAASTDAAPVWTTIYTGDADGSKITGLMIGSTDATAHLVTCVVSHATGNLARTVGATVTTGTTRPGYGSAVPVINMMAAAVWPGLPFDSEGNPYVFLASANDRIDCRFATAITSGTAIDITVVGGDF